MSEKKKSKKYSISYIIMIGILIIGAIFMLMPFYWLVTSTFKTSTELMQKPPTWFPKEITFKNFATVLKVMPFFKYFGNSLFVSVINTIVGIFTSCIAGYIFAKYDFKFKNGLFFLIISAMMIPFEVISIPLYSMVSSWNWTSSYLVLTVPYFVNIMGIFLMRQFMNDVPDELLEAAEIDGCGQAKTFFSIVMPIMKTPILTLAIILFTSTWDSYLWPLISVNSSKIMTLPIGLGTLMHDRGGKYDLLMAASFMSLLPMIVFFTVAQKRFIDSIAFSGIKG